MDATICRGNVKVCHIVICEFFGIQLFGIDQAGNKQMFRFVSQFILNKYYGFRVQNLQNLCTLFTQQVYHFA